METQTNAAMQMCADVVVQVTVVSRKRLGSMPPSDSLRRPWPMSYLAG